MKNIEKYKNRFLEYNYSTMDAWGYAKDLGMKIGDGTSTLSDLLDCRS